MLEIIFILIFIVLIIIFKITSEKKDIKYIDEYGYYRYSSNNKLIHRDIAYRNIYRKNRYKYPLRFREYQIHHKNRNKLDNNVNNLQIVTKEEHENIHGRKFNN